MAFQEKIAWLVVLAVVMVYGWYFLSVAQELGAASVHDIDYQGRMLATVVALVVLIVAGLVTLMVVTRDFDDQTDERDRAIDRSGQYVGGIVLAVGTLLGLGLTLLEYEHFWIANMLLLGLVLAEVAGGLTRIALYRRGMPSW